MNDELNNVELDGTETEVVEATDWKKNIIAIGLGALAVDGAVHVGSWVYKKAIEPSLTKVKNAIASKKASQAPADDATAKNSDKTKSN